MHHGGLGYIDNGKLYLPEDLLKPLSITHDSLLFGLYYPPPFDEKLYSHVKPRHDFMLTGVPYRLWPKVGRLVIRLKHAPHMTHLISEFIANKDVSILLTESSRSGHRFATWNLTVAFDYLQTEALHFDFERSVYSETFEELFKLKDAILENCKEALFLDFTDFYLREPVNAYPDTALAYFHEKSIKRGTTLGNEAWLFEEFKLRYTQNGVIETTQGEVFKAILDYISTPANRKLPQCVFANMNTNDMHIRVVIIPPEEQDRFAVVTFDYTRTGMPDTTRGIIAYLTGRFPQYYNIWNLITRTKISTHAIERGGTTFFIENQLDGAVPGADFQKDFRTEIDRICSQPLPTHLKHITSLDAHVMPISAFLFQNTLEKQRSPRRRYKYDVFISYATEDKRKATMVKRKLESERLICFMAGSQVMTGAKFADEIRKALLDSMEICLLFSPISAKSDWVKREMGAAWILDKHIVPMLMQTETKPEDLPEELRDRQAAYLENLSSYVQEVKRRKELLHFF